MTDEIRADEDAAAEAESASSPEALTDISPAEPSAPDAELAASERPSVRPIEFDPLRRRAVGDERASIDLLLDVKLPITVELGRTEVEVKEILEFAPGSIVELDKLANEPVDLLVNGVLVARGEVVVVEDNFGIRLTALVSPEERIRVLGRAA